MGRYRAPLKPSSPYITPEGEQRLQEELDYLWRDERPRVTKSVSEAAALGDRSENAEYIYGKKRLREIDRRVRYLRKRLENIKVIRDIPADMRKVYFGAWVELENEQGEINRYRLVGSDEIDPARNYISIDSPMSKALLGKQKDNCIVIQTPSGMHEYLIISVEYPSQ